MLTGERIQVGGIKWMATYRLRLYCVSSSSILPQVPCFRVGHYGQHLLADYYVPFRVPGDDDGAHDERNVLFLERREKKKSTFVQPY